MPWNNRVLKEVADGETTYSVHEVHYDDGEIIAWTEDAVRLDGFSSVKDLIRSLEMILADVTAAMLRRETRHSVINVKDLREE